MQKLIQTTFISSALLLAAFAVQAKTASEIYEQAAKSTVVVGNFDARGKQQSMGSGVVMPDGDVVTNCHVVKGASRLTVRVGQNERPATLRYSDWDRDVCALSTTGLNAPAVTVGSSKTLKVGAKVYAIGAPKGLELTLSDGIVSSLRDLEGGRYIQTTAAISPGSSGGGLYDDSGALVGLTTFYLSEGQSLNFAVPIDWIKDLPNRSIKTPQSVQTSTNWMSKTIELESLKDWAGLLAHTLRWTQAQPHNGMAWFGLGLAYNKHEQYPQAIYAYEQALRSYPEDAETWSLLGIAYTKTKQYPNVINAYLQALRIKPDKADTRLMLGIAYDSNREYTHAINTYQQYLRSNPNNAEAWLLLGVTSVVTKNYIQAISALQRSVDIKPDDASKWHALGLAYSLAGNRVKMMEVYKKMKLLDPALADVFYSNTILAAN